MIGDLRTRLSIFIPQNTPDEFGGVQTTWVMFGNVWAHVQPKAAVKRSENGRAAILKTYLVTIRWQRSFPERARLTWGDRTLRVLSASDPDLRHERLHLICEEEEQ